MIRNRRNAQRQDSVVWLLRDPLTLGAVLFAVVVVIAQFMILFLRPPWLGAETDWLRASLGWVGVAMLALACTTLTRSRQPGTLAWWMFLCAIIFYAFAQTAWLFYDQMTNHPYHFPTPPVTDIFLLLQYLFFFLALTYLPGAGRRRQSGISLAKMLLDSLLLMAAGTALSWYFFLAPMYLHSGQSALGKVTDLASPVGDLGLLFGLTVVATRQGPREVGRVALRTVIAAVIVLILADSWFAYLNLYAIDTPGDGPTVLHIAAYLLFALAGLARWRVALHEAVPIRRRRLSRDASGEIAATRHMAGPFRLLFPLMAALLASALLVTRAALAPTSATGDLFIPLAISFGLLVLVMLRQGIMAVENGRLLRAEQQRAEEEALANQLAEQQRRLLAERNQRLERDIEHLKDVHARVARGDHTARARIEKGELLPIAGTLNLMLDRLAKLNRANAEYVKLERAIQLVVRAAQGLVMGDEYALNELAAPTYTPLDAVALALNQLRSRIKDLGAGLQQLELARKAARELTEIAVQQGQFITSEGAMLAGVAGAFGRLAVEAEHAAQMLKPRLEPLTPANRPLAQVAGLLQLLVRMARQQQAEVETLAVRFVQAERRAQVAAVGGRRLAAELDAAARSGGSQIILGVPGMPTLASLDVAPASAPGQPQTATTLASSEHLSSSAIRQNGAVEKAPTAPLADVVRAAEQSAAADRSPSGEMRLNHALEKAPTAPLTTQTPEHPLDAAQSS